MRYTKKLILTVIGAFLMVQCDTSDLQNYSINPQAVNQINLNFFFTPAQLSTASGGGSGDNRALDLNTNVGMCSYAIQHLATVGFDVGDKYYGPEGALQDASRPPFEIWYNNPLKSLAEIIRQTGPGGYEEGKHVNLRNAARILRAFMFARLTDCFGSIPYFEALQATSTTPIFSPTYDKQKDIYADILKELEEAIAELSTSFPDEGFRTADIIYNGDIALWKKWGYSLMLRAAMKISTADPSLADKYVAKAVAGGVFTSNSDNVWILMATGPNQWVNQNGISRSFGRADGNHPSFLSRTLVNWLKGTDPGNASDDDPRLMIISGGIAIWNSTSWNPLNTDPLAQEGMPNGMDIGMLQQHEGTTAPVPLDSTYSKINYLLLQVDDPFMLMNYGEVELLLAEASQRGLGGLSVSQAQDHYNKGVKASMQMYDRYDPSLVVSDAQVTNYLATYPYGVTKPPLEMIGEQLWVNHFLNWWEAWADWRRTGFPMLVPTNYPGNVTGGTIPQRLKYPSKEVAGNPNFSPGATQPDLLTTKLWFAGGPE